MLKRVDTGDLFGVEQRVADLAAHGRMSAEQLTTIAEIVSRRLRAHVQRLALSRGGLADVVATLGEVPAHTGLPMQLRPHTEMLFGSRERLAVLASAAARRARVSHEQVHAVLPALIEMQIAGLAERSRAALTDVFARMPSLFHWSLGSMHADIADIIRRGCGAGPYNKSVLRRRVRAILAEAGGYAPRNVLGWYIARALAPASFGMARVGKAVFRPRV